MISTQRGQIVPIFGIMLVFVIGSVALAVDFGLLSNQHRNLQVFADQAALAGVQQLNPDTVTSQATSSQTAARRTALIYLRENLAGGNGATQLPIASLSAGTYAACWGSSATVFTVDIRQCQMPAPFSAYTVTICTPGETAASGPGCTLQTGQRFDTLSVRITETVSTGMLRAVGITTQNATGYAEAQFSAANALSSGNGSQGAYEPFSLYSNGCVTSGNQLQIIQGDVYLNQCSLQPQSGGLAGFCIESSPTTAGNLVIGPDGTIPVPAPVDNQSLATCQNTGHGGISVMGDTTHLLAPLPPPQFTPPPGYVDFNPNGTYSAAQPNNRCVNNTVAADGSVPNNCFNPGYYTTLSGISNNLNPGIYYVVGDPTCNASSNTTTCDGVNFSGDTLNANWNDVKDGCWASPNAPASGSFTAPCPDGFAVDPTSGVSDSQCTGAAFPALAAPLFSLASSASAGNLDPGGTGTAYFVRVTASNAFGESTSTESSVVVNSTSGNHSLTVTITAAAGATRYQVYVGTGSRSELQSGAPVSSGATTVTDSGSGTPYPRFDTSSCSTGFRNIPRSPDPSQNNGVTFVVYNKASFCANASCGSPSTKPTIMLSPFCSTYRFGLPVNAPDVAVTPPPGISAGTACAPPYATSGPYMNDGAFLLYGPSQGFAGNSGNGATLAMVGTVYMPSGTFSVGQNAILEIIPGQAVVHDWQVQSGNHQNPAIYFPCCTGTSMSSNSSLVAAQQPPRLHLVR